MSDTAEFLVEGEYVHPYFQTSPFPPKSMIVNAPCIEVAKAMGSSMGQIFAPTGFEFQILRIVETNDSEFKMENGVAKLSDGMLDSFGPKPLPTSLPIGECTCNKLTLG